uniref:Predicted gene 14891 n=1 Tax=Mus musculus TaxID=10090 RepID=A0ABJ3HP64_MOUSE
MKTRSKAKLEATQDGTPERATLSCSQRPAGDAPNLCEPNVKGGLMSSRLSRDIPVRKTEVSTTAASWKRKPISRASMLPRGQLKPCQDLSAPGEDTSSTSASLVQRSPQKRQSQSLNSWLPMVLGKTRRRKRDPKNRAAAMERVRQWEIHLLQDLEEATQHQLTVEDE